MAVNVEKVVAGVMAVGTAIVENESIRKMLCGTYSDGTARNIPDAINGEIYSPQQKNNLEKRIAKRKKKKKKAKSKMKHQW